MKEAHGLQSLLSSVAGKRMRPNVISALSTIEIGLSSMEQIPITPELRERLRQIGARANFLAARPTDAQQV